MKKVVRMLGLCALAALAFTSCKKNETNGTVTFKATIAQPTCDSRTHIASANGDQYFVLWSPDDVINVFNEAGERQQYAVQNVDNHTTVTASFSGDADFLSAINVENKYTAFYPAAEMVDNIIMMSISDEQMYKTNSFNENTYPMWARNTAAGDFPFTSDAGILNLQFYTDPQSMNLNGEYGTKIDYIRIISEDLLAGTLFYNLDGTYNEFVGSSNEVILRNADGQPMMCYDHKDTNFFIVLPEGALASGFVVEVYEPDNNIPIWTREAPANPLNRIGKNKITGLYRQGLPCNHPVAL